ncbi:hypothetical protein EV182_001061 [Spiromyces aspiralis]|uniref:Uncharacterized protein n=1 Tax=Spiromyces aspiralis TaxID=68401 RepID=A0ACC1HMJ0_9FUNG|nr:hypothetical protein EV182_001061 [Spiromyces aspiralis]
MGRHGDDGFDDPRRVVSLRPIVDSAGGSCMDHASDIKQCALPASLGRGRDDTAGPPGHNCLLGTFRVATTNEVLDRPPYYVPAGSVVFRDAWDPELEVRCYFARFAREWVDPGVCVLLQMWRYVPPPERALTGSKTMAYAIIEVLDEQPLVLPRSAIGAMRAPLSDRAFSWWESQVVDAKQAIARELESSIARQPPLPPEKLEAILGAQQLPPLNLRHTESKDLYGVFGFVRTKSAIYYTRDRMPYYLLELCCTPDSTQQPTPSDDGGKLPAGASADVVFVAMCGEDTVCYYPAISVDDNVYVTYLHARSLREDPHRDPHAVVLCSTTGLTKIYFDDDLDLVDSALAGDHLDLSMLSVTSTASHQHFLTARLICSTFTLDSHASSGVLPSHAQPSVCAQPDGDVCASNQLIRYLGEITYVFDQILGLYELDHTHVLLLAPGVQGSSLSTFMPINSPLRVGARITVDNAHVVALKDTEGYEWRWTRYLMDLKRRTWQGVSGERADYPSERFSRQSPLLEVPTGDSPSLSPVAPGIVSVFLSCARTSIRIVEFSQDDVDDARASSPSTIAPIALQFPLPLSNSGDDSTEGSLLWRDLGALELIEMIELCLRWHEKFPSIFSRATEEGSDRPRTIFPPRRGMCLEMEWSLRLLDAIASTKGAGSGQQRRPAFRRLRERKRSSKIREFLDHDRYCSAESKRIMFPRLIPIRHLRERIQGRLSVHQPLGSSCKNYSSLPVYAARGQSSANLGLHNAVVTGKLTSLADGRWCVSDETGGIAATVLFPHSYTPHYANISQPFDLFTPGDVVVFRDFAGICESVVLEIPTGFPPLNVADSSGPSSKSTNDGAPPVPDTIRSTDTYVACIAPACGATDAHLQSGDSRWHCGPVVAQSADIWRGDEDCNPAHDVEELCSCYLFVYTHPTPLQACMGRSPFRQSAKATHNGTAFALPNSSIPQIVDYIAKKAAPAHSIRLPAPSLGLAVPCLLTVFYADSPAVLRQNQPYLVLLRSSRGAMRVSDTNGSAHTLAIELGPEDHVMQVSVHGLSEAEGCPLVYPVGGPCLVDLNPMSMAELRRALDAGPEAYILPDLEAAMKKAISGGGDETRNAMTSFLAVIRDASLESCSVPPSYDPVDACQGSDGSIGLQELARSFALRVSSPRAMQSVTGNRLSLVSVISAYVNTLTAGQLVILPGSCLPGMVTEFHNVKILISECTSQPYIVTTGESFLRPRYVLPGLKLHLASRVLDVADGSGEEEGSPTGPSSGRDPLSLHRTLLGGRPTWLVDLLISVQPKQPTPMLIIVQVEAVLQWSLKFYCPQCQNVITSSGCPCDKLAAPPLSSAIPMSVLTCRVSDGTAEARLQVTRVCDILALTGTSSRAWHELYGEVTSQMDGSLVLEGFFQGGGSEALDAGKSTPDGIAAKRAGLLEKYMPGPASLLQRRFKVVVEDVNYAPLYPGGSGPEGATDSPTPAAQINKRKVRLGDQTYYLESHSPLSLQALCVQPMDALARCIEIMTNLSGSDA